MCVLGKQQEIEGLQSFGVGLFLLRGFMFNEI